MTTSKIMNDAVEARNETVKLIWQGHSGVINKLKATPAEAGGTWYTELMAISNQHYTAMDVIGVIKPPTWECDSQTRTGRKFIRHAMFGCPHCLEDKLLVIAVAKVKLGIALSPKEDALLHKITRERDSKK
tara:strand:- start:63 stop:455 length:393 start_codon:yes stop_codon:yes gene_type:complete